MPLLEPGLSLSHRATSPRKPSPPEASEIVALLIVGVRGCLACTKWDEVDGMDDADVRSPAVLVLACECDENDEGGRVEPAEANEGATAESIDEMDELRGRTIGLEPWSTLFIPQREAGCERRVDQQVLESDGVVVGRVDEKMTELLVVASLIVDKYRLSPLRARGGAQTCQSPISITRRVQRSRTLESACPLSSSPRPLGLLNY